MVLSVERLQWIPWVLCVWGWGIHDLDVFCSMSHRCVIGLGSGVFGGPVNTLGSLLGCSSLPEQFFWYRGKWATAIGDCCCHERYTWSTASFEWVVCVKWHPHEGQDTRIPSRTLHCNETINVIYITCLCFLMLWLDSVY